MLEFIVATLVGKVQVGPDLVCYDLMIDKNQIVSYIVRENIPQMELSNDTLR